MTDDLKRQLYEESQSDPDNMLWQAANRIEQLEAERDELKAALRGMMDAYNDLCDESEPNYRSFKLRQEKWEAANAALGKGKP